MIKQLCHRRRRWLLYKLCIVLAFLIILLTWTKQDKESRSVNEKHRYADGAYEKADQPLHHDLEDDRILPASSNYLVQRVQDQILQVVGPGKELAPSIDQSKAPLSQEEHERGVEKPEFVVPNRYRDEVSETNYEQELADDAAKVVIGLGEKGDPVHLEGEEAQRAEERMKQEAFNIILSDKISLNRSVPDTRDPLCKDLVYDSSLPQASVIIIFTNEAWSPLLRTIYSVLNRSPPKFLKEIILVDDFSDRAELKGKLDYFLRTRLPKKVRLLRLKERAGLIRARLAGAKVAQGDVLIFLDSHCETNIGWLEPLLQRVKEKPNAVLVPIIDVIDDKTMEYYHGNGRYFQVGGFSWSGHFTWIDITEAEEKRRGSQVSATRSPTMAGGLFAADRQYFWDSGSYDDGMDVWGGENLEMSFRIWQCGGTLETIPCSRVGHIFRSFHPYTFPGNKDTHGINTVRMVEVWMDDYKRLFYLHRPDLQSVEYGSISERQAFRKKNNCKDFSWYLKNIYPQKFILDEDSLAYGRVRSDASQPNLCLDNLQREEKKNYDLGVYLCHNQLYSSQFFSLSKNSELRREEACAEVPAYFTKVHEKVVMARCHGRKGNQEWVFQNGQLIHKATGKCLDVSNLKSNDNIYVSDCSGSQYQRWIFDHYNLQST